MRKELHRQVPEKDFREVMKNNNLNEIKRSDIFSHIPQISYMPRWGVLLMDLLLCSFAFWASVWVGSGFFHYLDITQLEVPIGAQYLIVMFFQLVSFWVFHTYSGILRYSTFIDTTKVLLSNISVGVFLGLFNVVMDFMTGHHPLLNAVLAIYVPVSFVMLFALRVSVKTLSEFLAHSQSNPRVMIYGTQSAGVAIAKMLRSSENAPYRPIGFIADKDERSNYDLAGLPVRYLNDRLFEWMAGRNIHHVIISPIKMREIEPSRDLQVFFDHNIRILTTPYFTQFDNALQLVNWMEDYFKQRIPVPDMLLNRISELGLAAEESLMNLLKKERATQEIRMAAVTLLREIDSVAPLEYYIGLQAIRGEGEDELADNALDSLASMGERAVEAMRAALPLASQDGQEDIKGEHRSSHRKTA